MGVVLFLWLVGLFVKGRVVGTSRSGDTKLTPSQHFHTDRHDGHLMPLGSLDLFGFLRVNDRHGNPHNVQREKIELLTLPVPTRSLHQNLQLVCRSARCRLIGRARGQSRLQPEVKHADSDFDVGWIVGMTQESN